MWHLDFWQDLLKWCQPASQVQRRVPMAHFIGISPGSGLSVCPGLWRGLLRAGLFEIFLDISYWFELESSSWVACWCLWKFQAFQSWWLNVLVCVGVLRPTAWIWIQWQQLCIMEVTHELHNPPVNPCLSVSVIQIYQVCGSHPKNARSCTWHGATVKLRVRSLQLEMFHWKSPFTSNFNGNSEVSTLVFSLLAVRRNAKECQSRLAWWLHAKAGPSPGPLALQPGQCSKKKRNLQLLEGIMIPVALDVCFIYMHEPSPIFSRMNAQNKEHKGRERSLSIQHITPQDTSTTSSNGKGRPEHIVWHTNYSLPCYVLQLYITK